MTSLENINPAILIKKLIKTLFFLRLFNISAPTSWHLTNSASKYCFRVFMLILLWHQWKNKTKTMCCFKIKKKVVSLCIAYVSFWYVSVFQNSGNRGVTSLRFKWPCINTCWCPAEPLAPPSQRLVTLANITDQRDYSSNTINFDWPAVQMQIHTRTSLRPDPLTQLNNSGTLKIYLHQ